MKIVIDTNVLISAALAGGKPRRVVLFVVDRSDMEWLVTDDILAEYRAVFSRPKFNFPLSTQQRWIDLISRKCTLVERTRTLSMPRDPADAKFLTCAASGEADFLITGDSDFSGILELGNTKILTVASFDQHVVRPLL